MTFDDNIPIPQRAKFNGIKIGQSKFFPNRTITDLSSSVAHAKRRFGFQFTSRTVEENGVQGVRVWRIR